MNLLDAKIEDIQGQIKKEEDEKEKEINGIYYPILDNPSFWRRIFKEPITREEAEKIYGDRHQSLLEIAMSNNEKISIGDSELR